MALYFGDPDTTTTVPKTDKFKPVQFIEPKKVIKGGSEGEPPRMGMATRAPLRFDTSGVKVTPSIGGWLNENVVQPAAGTVLGLDPLSQMTQGQYNLGGALDPLAHAYSYYKSQLTGGQPIGPQAVSQGVRELQGATPEWVRQATEVAMGGHPYGLGHSFQGPQPMPRMPEPSMPRPPGLQTPLRDILSRAEQPGPEGYMARPEDIAARQRTPEQVAVEERISPQTAQRARLRFAQGTPDEPMPGPPPPAQKFKNILPGEARTAMMAEMEKLEQRAPEPATRTATPQERLGLRQTEAQQTEAQKYGRSFIGEKGGPDAKWLIERAKEYEHQGYSPFEIWKQTTGLTEGTTKGLVGAFKGKDGKWRVELDDGSLVVEPGYLKHRAIDQRYPDAIKAGNINPTATEAGGISSARHEGRGTVINIHSRPDRARTAAAHEYQHGVQRQEDFARGGNWREFTNDPRVEREVQEQFKKAKAKGANLSDEDLLTNLRNMAARRAYNNLEGEAEARLAGKRVNYDRARRVLEPPFLDYDVAESERIVKPQIATESFEEDPFKLPPASFPKGVDPNQVRAKHREYVGKLTDELKDSVSTATETGVLRKAFTQLQKSPAISADERVYLRNLNHYTFIGESGSAKNPRPPIMVQAYNRLTSGNMFRPVPLKELYAAYRETAVKAMGTETAERKRGKDFYIKTPEQFQSHLEMYGTTIDELAKTPHKDFGPWVVDKENGLVYLAPRLPGEAGVRTLADRLSPTSGVKLARSIPRDERMGPELTTGRQPKEAAHHREFKSLFTERYPTATRGMPAAPEAGARKPGARGPSDTGKGKIVSRAGAATYPQQPKAPASMTKGPARSSGMRPVAGPRGGKVASSAPERALKGTREPSTNPIREAWHSVQSFLSPSTASEGARGAHQIVRSSVGENRRMFVQEASKIDAYRKDINALDAPTKIAIRDYIQGHDDVLPHLNSIKAPWMSFVKALRNANDTIAKEFQKLPAYRKKEFEENYLSQYWKESMRDKKKMSAKGHFMEKKYATYREGEAAGLHAKFDDPIEIQFQYMKDVFNFLAKERSLDEMLRLDYAKKLGKFEREPLGTTLLKHVGRRRIYAAEDVARVWENSWGPGVFEHTDMGKLYMGTVRALNASTGFVLGLSGYHAFNVAHGAAEMNIQAAIKALDAGKPWTAVKRFASAPGAPISLYRKGSVLHDVFTGKSMPKDAKTAKIANLLAQSNMTVAEFEQLYRSSGNKNWVEAFKQGVLGKELKGDLKGAIGMDPSRNPLGSTYSLFARTLDTTMHPLFAHAIPRMKVGAFFVKMNDFIEHNPGATEFERVREAQRIADSIENVEGLMTQQNVMVAPLLKQTANLILMAPGWTFGAIRAYGQGAVDLGRYAGKAAIGRKEPMSQNAAYVLAAATTMAGMSAMAQLYMCGELPSSPMDLIAPRTGGKNRDGSPERLLMPGNFKDLLGYYHDAWGELGNKVRPPWRAAKEELANKQDYRGVPIRNINDPLSKQLQQAGQHILKTIGAPISFQQYGTAERGSNIGNAARVAGFRPIGQWLANPERTGRLEHRHAQKEWQRKLKFERRDENRRAPVTAPLRFGKPPEAPKQPLRFAPQ